MIYRFAYPMGRACVELAVVEKIAASAAPTGTSPRMVTSDPLFAISFAVLVATVYLLVLRAVDLNEREPLWALGLVMVLGMIAGATAAATVDPEFRTLSSVGESVSAELPKFAALALGVACLEGIARLRGWSEFNDVTDGVVYGVAAGLGVACGETLVRELTTGVVVVSVAEQGTFTLLWTTLLHGMAEGMSGAVIGAGFGAALHARSALQRAFLALGGLLLALALHVAYVAFAEGNSLSGSQVRQWVALVLPVVVIALLALRFEQSAIARELTDEAGDGTVTEAELKLLRSPGARRVQYYRRLARGDLEGSLSLRALHNRQVQLALVERRARREVDPQRRREIDGEAQNLRASIAAIRRQMSGGSELPQAQRAEA